MKKSTKAILLTALTLSVSCNNFVGLYGPAPDTKDVTDDTTKNIVVDSQQNLDINIDDSNK